MIFSHHMKKEFINILKTLLMCIGPLGFRYTLGLLYYTYMSPKKDILYTVYPREIQ